MPNTIRFRRGSGAPDATSFAVGEPAWDEVNGNLYVKNGAGTMVQVGGGSASGSVSLNDGSPTSPSLYFGMSLGMTFPFNILLGIPIYVKVAHDVLA